LVLEDIEIAIAEVQERQDDRARRTGAAPSGRRASRAARAFPAHLPRIEQVIEPESLECPCGCGQMVRIGEDRSRRLDVTPAQYRVVETV
ncbi:IS66 family transposase zinc-finger binding domain-containing protein, partial [Klebsiella pneumoniae]|nr:IS66 family transposase zinc-finger binding domain-containing protein [Klebsiella pneumoniae]